MGEDILQLGVEIAVVVEDSTGHGLSGVEEERMEEEQVLPCTDCKSSI